MKDGIGLMYFELQYMFDEQFFSFYLVIAHQLIKFDLFVTVFQSMVTYHCGFSVAGSRFTYIKHKVGAIDY